MPSTSPPVPITSPRPAGPRLQLSAVVEHIAGRPVARPLRGLLDDLDETQRTGEQR